MYLSTVVSTDMLNVNGGVTLGENFTLPYNFVPGRKIELTITPQFSFHVASSGARTTAMAGNANNNTNSITVEIPSDVTEYTVPMTIVRGINPVISGAESFSTYTLNVTFNTTTNTIKFQPVLANVQSANEPYELPAPSPVLINIVTLN